MINTDDLQLTKLDYAGLKQLVQWAEEEGWNPGPYDADVYWATDPDGFYGYYNKGELIAGGSIVVYGREFGFMGFFIVKPEYRSNGIGRKLWHQRRDKLISRLDTDAPIGMDGVVAMQKFYQKGGFEIAYRDFRYEVVGKQYNIDAKISEITDADIENILDYDQQCFGYSRDKFIISWLKMPGIKTFKYSVDSKLQGFAIVRKANIGYKICPLFANTPAIAEQLYKACMSSAQGEPIYLDIPESNIEAMRLVEKYDAKYVFECARMYRGNHPKIDINKVFGITTFELG